MTRLILAPLRGVTIRCFRETFAAEIAEAGFSEAVTPFIAAEPGFDPLKDRELRGGPDGALMTTPQFIGKNPDALRRCLERVKAAGYGTADLNCGCPFPMVRNKGRGSGLLRTPDVLRNMLEAGCETMGPGKFSMKARLGVDGNDELERLMPVVNDFPLRFLAVHGRVARQMYGGVCDTAAVRRIIAASKVPVVVNGDIMLGPDAAAAADEMGAVGAMVGRSFVRGLGSRTDARGLLLRYIDASRRELFGDRPVLGRIKELVSCWKELPAWRRKWNLVKVCASVDELLSVV